MSRCDYFFFLAGGRDRFFLGGDDACFFIGGEFFLMVAGCEDCLCLIVGGIWFFALLPVLDRESERGVKSGRVGVGFGCNCFWLCRFWDAGSWRGPKRERNIEDSECGDKGTELDCKGREGLNILVIWAFGVILPGLILTDGVFFVLVICRRFKAFN